MRVNLHAPLTCSLIAAVAACAHAHPPADLLRAREVYTNAQNGPALALDPADLHEARIALDAAEEAANRDPESFEAQQLAYLALRRAELADAEGKTAVAINSRDAYSSEEQKLKDQLLARTQKQLAASAAQTQHVRGELESTQGQLDSANAQQQETQSQLEAERDARLAAEKSGRGDGKARRGQER